jgi:molybdenum cofactor synthesis domain-containing protein
MGNDKYTAAVLTVSDKSYAGEREDTGGPLVRAMLDEAGYEVTATATVPDEREMIEGKLAAWSDEDGIALIVTTGGTGFSPRDVTPEATLAVSERAAPGIPEAMRLASLKVTPRGMLSRSAAGIRGKSLIVNLPGSPKAIRENLEAVLPTLAHGLEMLRGGPADCAAQ